MERAALLRSHQGRLRLGSRRRRREEPGRRRDGRAGPSGGGGADFAGTVVLVAASDEEDGDYGGARWLVQNRPDLVRCDYLLNEGGGEYIEVDGRRTYPLTVGEKGTAQFKLTLHGDGGHASVPLLNSSAVTEVARAINALTSYETELSLEFVPELLVARAMSDAGLRTRLLDPQQARAALAELRAVDADVSS